MESTRNAWSSDSELVAEILGGSEEHFQLLYETYFRRVYSFALKRLKDPGEAEDVTQEVFITLMDALSSYQGQSSLLVWIFGVTRNKVNRRFRRARPPIESIGEEGSTQLVAPGAPTDVVLDARRDVAAVRGDHREGAFTSPKKDLSSQALETALDTRDCPDAGQVRGCDQGPAVSDSPHDCRGHPRP